MIFVVLWTAIFAFLAIYLGRSPKVKGWLKVLGRNPWLWRAPIAPILLVVIIAGVFLSNPDPEQEGTNDRLLFEKYAAQSVLKLDSLQKFKVDSSCSLEHPMPELAYVLPVIVDAYEQIVEKPTMPVITQFNDTLHFVMNGYKLFKNRGTRLNKRLRKRLGNRYAVKILSEGSTHTLEIVYTGTPWDTEQLAALPVLEAAQTYHVDAALLMSLIRHVSNFNFDYRGQKDTHGLLSLDHGEGLEQIFIGAERLSNLLNVHKNYIKQKIFQKQNWMMLKQLAILQKRM